MMIVGLTGGIGSGKSTVARFFSEIGVPVYIADDEAKRLTNRSKVIRRKLIALLGEEAYDGQGLNRSFVASKIFKDSELLAATNAIIHPKVGAHFKRWVHKQSSDYVIKEAAILFENGSYKNCDVTILVTAPKKIRVERILQRDDTTIDDIESRMSHQWDDDKKRLLAHFQIENISLPATKETVASLHLQLTIQSKQAK